MQSESRSIAVLFLEAGCNMACDFCITEDTQSSMRYDQARHVLDVVAARGMDTLVLGGGEPCIWRPGLFKFSREAKQRGFVVQVGTNGVALPRNFARIPSIDRYVLPLDGMDADVHDRLRHYPGGHHRLILRRLERLRRAGKAVTVSTVVTADNLLCLPKIATFLQDYVEAGGRLHAWHLYQFIPAGRGGRIHAERLQISEEAYIQACARVRAMPHTFTIYKRRDMRHSATVDFFWYEGEQLVIGSERWGAEEEAAEARQRA